MRLLIGVSGGVAAYKAIETVRLATKAGHAVRVIQTPTSERFVGRATFAAITGAPVLVSEFDEDPARGAYPGDPPGDHTPISHLALVERADVYLIAPASANTLAKLAQGLCDNLVATAALAAACPVVVAPAMNHRMYLNPATRANLARLREHGLTVLEPDVGPLASRGEYGVGRLPDPAVLLAAAEAAAAIPADRRSGAGSWEGRRVLVSAGGTREPIDAVRYIGNHSSGRMGYALAERARARGAAVTLLSANVALDPPAGVELVAVTSAAELAAEAEARFESCDVLVMAAAVADFRPARPAVHKLKKTGPDAPSRLELEPTPDIIAGLAGRRRADQVLVGFAAEYGDGAIAYGRDKLIRKGLDVVVVNDISRTDIGFSTAENEVTILTATGEQPVPKAAKTTVADAVLDTVDAVLVGRAHGPEAGVGAARA